MLAAAKCPVLFVGDGVAYSDAQREVQQVAELLGAEIWGVDCGEVNADYDHPLFQGQTGHMFGFASRPITSKGDVNLVAGTYMVPEVYPSLDDIYAPGARVIHFDLDATAIARNHRVTIAAVVDPKLTLALLARKLQEVMNDDQKKAAAQRSARIGEEKAARIAKQKQQDRSSWESTPLSTAKFMHDLAKALPADSVVFDEALTSSPELTRYMPPHATGQFFQTRGGSLGVGFPGAIAAKLAFPERTAVGFSGDGGSMYTIQALWTAAHYGIDAKFVVCNNQSYKLLKLNVQQYWKEQQVDAHQFPNPFELDKPVIDFAALARSMGIEGVKVERPEQINPSIERMLQTRGPFLIDLVISNHVPGEVSICKCGQ